MEHPNWSAMVSESARMVVDLLESSPGETQATIAKALNAGAELSVRMVVLPRARLTVEIEADGARHVLATVPLTGQADMPKRH